MASRYEAIEESLDDEEGLHLESEESWAVSYADMLMVLLSFFVIFFSMTPEKEKQVISSIELGLSDHPVQQRPQDSAKVAEQEESPVVSAKKLQSIYQSIKDLNLDMDVAYEVENKAFIIKFPHNTYTPLQFALPESSKFLLLKVLRSIESIENMVELVFVGHTDKQAVRTQNGVVKSNHTLSALRATSALEWAVKMGFPASRMFAQGGAFNQLNSRTLHVHIRVLEKKERY